MAELHELSIREQLADTSIERVVYLMRGLPSCGKSYSARNLAGRSGVICETDEYFYTQVGTDPNHYDFLQALLPVARAWNLERFKAAILAGKSPIIVDRGNGRNPESRAYAQYAIEHGYRAEIKEPESPWWQEIRNMLQDKNANWPELEKWADRLAELNRSTHGVSASTIRHWMAHWRANLTVEDILSSPG